MGPARTPLFARHQVGGVLDIAHIARTPGYAYFVDASAAGAGATVGHGQTPDKPFSSVAYAFSSDVVTAGDTVYVMPGHTETIAAAGGITQDIAGVKVVGLGWGAMRPTFTWSATDSTWAISAANSVVENIRVTSSVNELVTMFNITGADWRIGGWLPGEGVDYIDPGAALETIGFILTTAAADRGVMSQCYHVASTAAAAAQLWVKLVGVQECRILDNTFILKLFDHATSAAINADASCRLLEFGRNRGHITGYSASLVSAVIASSGATGMQYESYWYTDGALITTINDCPTMASFEVYCSRTLDKNGTLDPVIA